MTPLHTRPPLGEGDVHLVTDDDALASVREDASHMGGGQAIALALPATEAGVARVLASAARVLPIGAQSSVTGGGTPFGEVVLSTRRFDGIGSVSNGSVRVGAGVTLHALQAALTSQGAAYPPAPTYTGATIGGAVATNAAGAATFKDGATRPWVEALTVVLASGEVLDIERGAAPARDGRLTIDTAGGRIVIPVPRYRPPRVAKCSAGYHAADDLDPVDLFIGAEGTLGIVTAVTLRVVTPAPARCLALVACPSEETALALTGALRDAARATWQARDPRGLDVSAIEMLDRRSVRIVQEDGAAVRQHVHWPADTDTVLLIEIELRPATRADDVYAAVARADDPLAEGPVVRFCRLLDWAGLLDRVELAAPGEQRRAEQFAAVREAVPAGVNQRVARAAAAIDPRISKTAADMVVPFAAFATMLARYREEFAARGLDAIIWGHASDGNVHPNIVPRSYDDVVAGRAAILACGRAATALGGCPLAEHGVGRHPTKQQLLRELYGEEGIAEMRAVKRALDPDGTLAPGVVFPVSPA